MNIIKHESQGFMCRWALEADEDHICETTYVLRTAPRYPKDVERLVGQGNQC